MNFWILVLFLVGLFFYYLGSMIFAALANFKFHDYYLDEDLKYERRRPDGIPEDAFLVDFHCHTTASDGLLEPHQLVLWSIANGYDGLVVSDHNTMENVQAVKDAANDINPSFLVIPGVEFTSMRVHLNLIGVQTPVEPKPGMVWCSKEKIKQAIDHAHEQGGVVQFNHKDWYPYNVLKHLSREWWMEQGIDGWEVYNGFKFIDQEALDFIDQKKEIKTMYASAGTDVHDPAKHYRVYTEVLTEDRTIDGVLNAVKQGKTRLHFEKEWRVNLDRPEKGKVKLNPDRQAYLKKTLLINWLGVSLFEGTHRWAIITFTILVISLGVLLSFLV
mgnify:CR=1 FL=1